MKINDLVHPGEVLIVQQPHRFPTKIYGYISIEEAFKAFSADGNVYPMPPLKEQDLEQEFDYLRHNDYAEQTVEEKIQQIKDELAQAGITEDQPYIMWEVGSYCGYFPDTEKGRLDLLEELARDDMYSGRVFIAEENQTYKEFLDDVYDKTRGHNEPSYRKLILGCALGIDEDLSFNLDKIIQVSEYNDFEVEYKRNNHIFSCNFKDLDNPESPVIQVSYNPYRPKDFMQSFEQAAASGDGNMHLKELALELRTSLKESFATNYTKEYVGKQLVDEAMYLKAINPEATAMVIAAKAQENILLYEENVKTEFFRETKRELLQKFFQSVDINNEKKLTSFIASHINPKQSSRKREESFERNL